MAPVNQPQLDIQLLSQTLSRSMSGGLFAAASSSMQGSKQTRQHIASIDSSFKKTERAIVNLNKTIQAQLNKSKYERIEEELEKRRNLTSDAFDRFEDSIGGLLKLMGLFDLRLTKLEKKFEDGGLGIGDVPPFARNRGGGGSGRGGGGASGPRRGGGNAAQYRDPKTGRYAPKPQSRLANAIERFRGLRGTVIKPPAAGVGDVLEAPRQLPKTPGGRGTPRVVSVLEAPRPLPKGFKGTINLKLPSGREIPVDAAKYQKFLASNTGKTVGFFQKYIGKISSWKAGAIIAAAVEGSNYGIQAIQLYIQKETGTITEEIYNQELKYLRTNSALRLGLVAAISLPLAGLFGSMGAGGGAAIGSLAAGVGAVPGALVGGVAGGLTGGYIGYVIADAIANSLTDILFGHTTIGKIFDDTLKSLTATTTNTQTPGVTPNPILGYKPSETAQVPGAILGYGAQPSDEGEVDDVVPQAILGYGAEQFTKPSFEGPPGERMSAGRVEEIQQQVAKVRKQPITNALRRVLETAAAAAGVNVTVTSGGQPNIRTGSRNRVGTTRHDDGNAADLDLYVIENGKKRLLSDVNPQDRAIMARFISAAVQAGATGIGLGGPTGARDKDGNPIYTYMGSSKIHVGFGPPATWGGSSWIKNAAAGIGRRGPEDVGTTIGDDGQPQIAPPPPAPSLESPDEVIPNSSPMTGPTADRVTVADAIPVDKKISSDYDPTKYSLASFEGDINKHNRLIKDAFAHLYGGGIGALA